jgi:hypothetical protein
MTTQVSFTLCINNEDRVGTAHTTISVTEDVPNGIDPRDYLRDRILKEFGITVQQPAPAAEAAADVNTGNVETVTQ